MLLNVLYAAVAGNLMDIGENNRFRYVIDPFILLLAVHIVYKYVSSKQSKAFQPSDG